MNSELQNLLNILIVGKPVWTICLGALFCLFLDALWPKKLVTVTYGAAILSLIAAFVMAFDQWMHPERLASQDLLIMDRFTLFFLALVIFIAIITLLNALGYLRLHQGITSEFSALVLFSVAGMIFLFASDHLIVNFIGLETMSLSVYVLVGSSRGNIKSGEAALKYFILGGVTSAVLLYGIALFYGGFGTLRLSELASMLAAPELEFLRRLAIAFILVGLFFKLAVVPFHFWAPDVYQGAPAPVTGFMATGVKAAAFGLTIRIFMQFDLFAMPQVQKLLSVIVVATFIVGNLAAIAQEDVKRMLAYSSISHAGYLLFGILAGFRDGHYDAASADSVMFYLFGYFFMTLGAFAVLSLMAREKDEATALDDLRGLGAKHPLVAGVLGLFLLSMMGLPPTVGFAAKYGVVALAVKNGHVPLAIVAVAVSVISAYYYLRPIGVMFFKEDAGRGVITDIPLTIYFTITFCAFAVIALGLGPDTYVRLSQIAVSVWR